MDSISAFIAASQDAERTAPSWWLAFEDRAHVSSADELDAMAATAPSPYLAGWLAGQAAALRAAALH